MKDLKTIKKKVEKGLNTSSTHNLRNPTFFPPSMQNSETGKPIQEPPLKDNIESADVPDDPNDLGCLHLLTIFFSIMSIVLMFIEKFMKKNCTHEAREAYQIFVTIVDVEEIDEDDIKLDVPLQPYNNFAERFFYSKVQGEELQKIIFEAENKSCRICLEDFEISSNVRALKCSHIYHKNCIDECILKSSFNCPYCRYSLI